MATALKSRQKPAKKAAPTRRTGQIPAKARARNAAVHKAYLSEKGANKRDLAPKTAKKRRYEGASKAKRLSLWRTSSSDANGANKASLTTLRDRARDLRRNNGWASRGVMAISSNTVGKGISTQFRDAGAVRLEAAWKAWAETQAFDFDGRHDIYSMQKLIMEAVVESGEVLVRKRYTAGRDFPLQYQVLENDFLDTEKNEALANGGYIMQGIEFDSAGRRQAYWLFDSHPGAQEANLFSRSLTSSRVLAEDVQHVFRQDRPGQARGITWFAPVIVRLKDLDGFEDAQLVRQKLAACFTAFVKTTDNTLEDFDDGEEDPYLGTQPERMEPGMIEELPYNKDIVFSQPPELQNYEQFVRASLRAVAAALGITYESFTQDLSSVNFSSGRMGWLEMMRNLESWRDHILKPQFLDPVVLEFKKMEAIKGTPVNGSTHVHVSPKREMIDPTKEIPASIEAIQSGLSTLTDELLALGKDPVEHFKKYAADQKTIDDYKLKLSSDYRIAAAKAEGAARAEARKRAREMERVA